LTVVGDLQWHAGELTAVGRRRQNRRFGVPAGALVGDEDPEAQRVAPAQRKRGVQLRAVREGTLGDTARDAVEGKVAKRIGSESDAAITTEGGKLVAEVAGLRLVGDNGVVVLLTLPFVERGGIGRRGTRDGEARDEARCVRDLELAGADVEEQAEAAGRVDLIREVAEAPALIGCIVEGVRTGSGVLDAESGRLERARDVEIELASAVSVLEARLEQAMAAAIKAGFAAAELVAGLGRDVHDPGVSKPEFGGESAVREADRFHEVRIDLLGEAVEALGEEDAVDPVLEVPMLAPNVDLPEGVLHHARAAQQDLLKGGVVSLRQGVDLIAADGVNRGAEARDDLAGHVFELAGDDDGLLEGPGALVSREQALPEIFGLALRPLWVTEGDRARQLLLRGGALLIGGVALRAPEADLDLGVDQRAVRPGRRCFQCRTGRGAETGEEGQGLATTNEQIASPNPLPGWLLHVPAPALCSVRSAPGIWSHQRMKS
jgi:hypothetical protein